MGILNKIISKLVNKEKDNNKYYSKSIEEDFSDIPQETLDNLFNNKGNDENEEVD